MCVGEFTPACAYGSQRSMSDMFSCACLFVVLRESLTATGTQISAVLAGQGAHGINPPLRPTIGTTGVCCHIPLLHGY